MLRELQLHVARHLCGADDRALNAQICTNGLMSGDHRLQIYRNNSFVSLTEALRAVYPVIERLVGKEFFRYAADRYIRQFPPASGNLHEFGEYFAEFLEAFPAAVQLSYLPDMARLEWAYHTVFHAVDHPFMNIAALQTVPSELYGRFRFRLHPAARLLVSGYPVLRIWQVNQPDYIGDSTVALAEGGVRLLVIRRCLEVELVALEAGEFMLLTSLFKEFDFAAACQQALAAQPGANLPECFCRHVSRGTLVDFVLC